MAKSISAFVTDALAEEFQRAVEVDGMPAACVAAQAIDLYALLPTNTRKGLGYVRDHGTDAEQDELVLEIARAVARARYKVATRQIRDGLEPEAAMRPFPDALLARARAVTAGIKIDHDAPIDGPISPGFHAMREARSGQDEEGHVCSAPATLTPDRALEATGALTCHRCGAPARWRAWSDVWIAACVAHAPEDDDA